MPFSDQQISAAHASLEQGNLPTILVDESQSDEMTQLIINWIRTNITKVKERWHGDRLLTLLVNIAANRIEVLEKIKKTEETLLKAIIDFKDSDGHTSLSKAVQLDCAVGIDWFINNGADTKWRTPSHPNYTLLHLAAEDNAISYIQRLKAAYKDKDDEFRQTLNLPDDYGYSPLALAVLGDKAEAINCLIEYGADTNWKSLREKYNLFSLAASYNATQALELLKATYKDKDDEFKQAINFKDADGNVPLVLAVRDDNWDVIDWLVENGADLNWRSPVDRNYTLLHEAATYWAATTLVRLRAAYKDNEFKQLINSPDKYGNSLLTLVLLDQRREVHGTGDQGETIDWIIDNCFISCSAREIDSVVKYFKDCFHDLIGRQEVKDGRLRHQNDFEKYFNSLLKYAGICHSSSLYLPDFFKDLYEVARSYAILKYPQVYYSPLPGKLPLFPLASVLVELVDAKTFPVEYLHTYLQTRENINWEIFVAKVAGIEVEAGANDVVIAKLAKQHTYNNIFGKMADEIANAIYQVLESAWPVGIHIDYKLNIRKIIFELLIEKNSRIVGMINKPNPIQTSSHSASAQTSSSSLFSKPQQPYYISPLALKTIVEELVELTNQRNSCNLRTKEIKEVVSKYIYNPSKQLDVESTSAKRRKLNSPDEQNEKLNPELNQPATLSSASTASTPGNKRKAESELQWSDNNDDDDENPAAAKKPKSNASDEQERNLNPEQEQPSTQAAAKNNNNDDGPLSPSPVVSHNV